MKLRKLGDRHVGEIGLGCMGMSFAYGASDEAECLRVFDRALALGCNFWDTADMYGAGANESLLAKRLNTRRAEVFLATKFGNVYDRSMTSHQDQVAADAPWIVDGTPTYVKKACERSLQRLGVDTIDPYYQHRVDPKTPIEETIGAMAELVQEGKVRFLGLSEASAATIRKANALHPITAVQSEYSLWSRDYEHDVIPVCEELGITFVPYSPLGRGFLTGEIKSLDDLGPDDWRRLNPRFQGDNFQKNLELVAQVKRIAAAKGVSASQIALAWVLDQNDTLIPIPGTKRIKYLEENCSATTIVLTEEEEEALAGIMPASGGRYPAVASQYLNL